jgi:hypothetical protein
MRVAVIVVSILVVATSSYASDSCMTKDEARSHFATSYLYWHGPGHCWDANSGRRQLIRNQRKNDEVVRKEDREPKWLEAHSQLLSSNEAPSAPPIAAIQNLRDVARDGRGWAVVRSVGGYYSSCAAHP